MRRRGIAELVDPIGNNWRIHQRAVFRCRSHPRCSKVQKSTTNSFNSCPDHMRSPIQSIFRRQLTAYIFGRLPPIFPARNTVAYRSFASSHSYYNRAPRLEPQDRRLQMTFTCTADDCGHRSTHEFSARAYESGIVLLTCPSCKNRYVSPSCSLHKPY
jgi:hypothetical protein